MRRAPSFDGRGNATFGERLIDQRTRLWNIRRQTAQLIDGILLPLEHEALTDQVEVKAITRSQTQRRSDSGRNHYATLLTEHQCGIH
jgi:hypothetical protein